MNLENSAAHEDPPKMGITFPGDEQSQICMGEGAQEPLGVFPEGLSQAKQDWIWLPWEKQRKCR